MNLLRPRLKYLLHPGAFCLALLVLLLYMVMRDAGLYPTIMGDEWTYSSLSRLTPFRETIIPSYLYFSLYRLTNQCGDAFIGCSQLINAVLFVGAAPFIYLVARRVANAPVAAIVALLAVAGPANSYAGYYMPEAMYFCAFWAFSALVFWFFDRRSTRRLLCSAAVLGLMAMIKVHAMFLVPAYCAFLVYAAWAGRDDAGAPHWLRRAATWVGLALLTALAVRMAVGYLFAGAHGLGLFGQMYGQQASFHADGFTRIRQALANLRGHIMALGLLAGLPLAAMLLHAFTPALRGKHGEKSSALMAYTFLMMGALLGVTVLFTAAVSGHGAESNARLHMRYYDFLLPLLLILAGSHINHALPVLSWRRKAAAALIPAALIVYASVALIPAYSPNFIDSPALFGFTTKRGVFYVLSACALLALGYWVVSMRRGAQLFVFLLTPLLAVVGAHHINKLRAGFKEPDTFIKAGMFARDYLGAEDRARLVLVGEDPADLFKTRFMIDDTKVELKILPRGQAITDLPEHVRWLLVIGPYPAAPGTVTRVSHHGFKLVERAGAAPASYTVNFSLEDGAQDHVRMWGMSYREDWGRWSLGKTAYLEFARALPRQLRLNFEAAAYGPNAGQEFVFRIGAEERRIKVPGEYTKLSVEFATSGEEQLVMIEVPQPTSPQQLGQSQDSRPLGIGLKSIEVEDLAK